MSADFSYSDTQRTVKEFTCWIAKEKIRPRAIEADRMEEVPYDLIVELKAMGITMDTGGGGRDVSPGVEASTKKGEREINRSIIIAIEELAWGDAAITLTMPGAGLGGPPVQTFGTPEQKERFFGIFKDREPKWGAYATTEPGCGSDVSGIQMRAIKDGSHYVLNGTKTFITNGNLASWVVVFATIDSSKGRRGLRAFVVERGTPGFIQGQKTHKMGLRASDTAILSFDDCHVHVDNLLGGERFYEEKGGGGFRVAMGTFDATRPMVAAMGIGIARASFEYTKDWLKEQYMLNRPIERYDRTKEKLAEMERKLETARLLTFHAAWMADVGMPNTKEASMCKAYMGKVALEICSECVDLLGDSGSTQEHPVERWFRDVKVYDIFEGTGQINCLVVGRRLYETFEVRI